MDTSIPERGDEHTICAVDEALAELENTLYQMGRMAREMVSDATQALVNCDSDLAGSVCDRDARLDELQLEIEKDTVAFIARHQPLAIDLRRTVGTVRIASDLERVGDLAKNISRRVQTMGARNSPLAENRVEAITGISSQALRLLDDAVTARARADSTIARAVWHADKDLDASFLKFFRQMLSEMPHDLAEVETHTHILFCAKNIERIGDHATNIAESVMFQVSGMITTLDRPKG